MLASWRRASWPILAGVTVLSLVFAGGVLALGAGMVAELLGIRGRPESSSLSISPDGLRAEGPGPLSGTLTVLAGNEADLSSVAVRLWVVKGEQYLERMVFPSATNGTTWEVSTSAVHWVGLGHLRTGSAAPFLAEMDPAWLEAPAEAQVRLALAVVEAGDAEAQAESQVAAYVTLTRGDAPRPQTPSGVLPAVLEAQPAPTETPDSVALAVTSETVAGPDTDIRIDRVRVLPVAPTAEGWKLDLEVSLANTGSGTSGPLEVALYFDLDSAPGPGDVPAARWQVEPLEAGQRVVSRLMEVEVTQAITLVPGEHRVWVWAGPASETDPEADQGNNLLGPYTFELFDVPASATRLTDSTGVAPLRGRTATPIVLRTRVWLPTTTASPTTPATATARRISPTNTRTPVTPPTATDTRTPVSNPPPAQSTPLVITSTPSSTSTSPSAPSATRTGVPSPSATGTPVSAPTRDATASATPSSTATATRQPTATLTPWPTRTSTTARTPMPTVTSAPAATLTSTVTPRPTSTLPPSATATRPTNTPTSTPKPTQTQVPTNTLEPTNTPVPTSTTRPTSTSTSTYTPQPTNTRQPTATPEPTSTPKPTNTPQPTDTPVPTPQPTPTDTPEPPTPTVEPPTATPVPTDTPVPPTDTPVPTETPIPPTDTPVPTETPIPPTDTPVPTDTAIPPTDTPAPPPPTDVPTDTPDPPTATPEPPTPTPEPPPTDTPEPPTPTPELVPTDTPVPPDEPTATMPVADMPTLEGSTATPEPDSGSDEPDDAG